MRFCFRVRFTDVFNVNYFGLLRFTVLFLYGRPINSDYFMWRDFELILGTGRGREKYE